MQPNLFERSLNLNRFYKYNRTSKFLFILNLKLISQKQNFTNRITIKLNLSANKAEKDIGIYKSSISKLEQAKELIEELRTKDKKKEQK